MVSGRSLFSHPETAFATEIWAQMGVPNTLKIHVFAYFVELSHVSRVNPDTDMPQALRFTIQN